MYTSMLVQAIFVIFCTVLGIGSSSRTYPYVYVSCDILECEEGTHCVDGRCVDICKAPRVYNPCASICFATCKTINDPPPKFCPTVCNPQKCICPPGLIESGKDQTCVKPSACPCYKVRCGRNEECIDGNCECIKGYRKNKYGVCKRICPLPKIFDPCSTACPKTCEDPNPQVCTEQCRIDDCVCPEGMLEISSKDSTCVKPKECKKYSCPAPKIYDPCSTACPKTCENPNPQLCTKQCRLDDCVCPDGMLEISSKDSTCVKPEECKKYECPAPKVYDPCSTACPKTCENLNPTVCTLQCRENDCVCPDGLVERSSTDDTCVKPESCKIPCPKQCPEMSECKDGKCVCKKGFTMNNNQCYDKCIHMRCVFCKRGKCWPPVCGEGLVRRADGSCAETCSKGKVFQKCPSLCPKRCDDPNPQHCGQSCRQIQCVCPKGYYERSLLDDTCVRLWDCRKKTIY